MDEIPDPRCEVRRVYHKRFLVWSGLMLFACKLGSRRQMNFHFNPDGPQVLNNLNRLAETQQKSCPVDKTLEYFWRRAGSDPLLGVRQKAVHRLVRMKALDEARLQGRAVVLIDGSGYLSFSSKHCEHCLTQQHGEATTYMHQVLEAKLLGPAGTVFSIGTEFIDNRDVRAAPAGAGREAVKQDCELKALRRLMKNVRAEHPQLRMCLSGDSLFACGEAFQVARDYHCDFIYVFKEGRMPALWADFQALLGLAPDQQVEITTPQGVHQVYRWVNELDYTDSGGRNWKLNAIQCNETKDGEETRWAWLTNLKVNRQSVMEVATKGGRERWRAENEGFNTQKNSGMNLEHAYSHKCWQAYYYLLQLAHMLLQLLEKGNLLLHLARQQGKPTAVALFGSLKNMAVRLLESLRQRRWPEEVFDRAAARKIQIRLNSS